jgi:uncharacterized membrane protein YdbT with pleckstrin-like domain
MHYSNKKEQLMVAWYYLILALAVGGAVTSLVEYLLKYNLTDEEVDLAKSIFSKATTAEKNVLSKLSGFGRKLEFWKKA